MAVHHPSLLPPTSLVGLHAYGSVLSFDVGSSDRARSVLERVRLITHAVSLGDARSLITHPKTTTHASMPADARERAGIGEGLLRLSVGLESPSDLERDLVIALDDRTG
jgi:cystathionine beta-lyase/cystathionine gamma-synthase